MLGALAGQMQYTYFPVTLDQCGAKIRYHDLVEGTFDIDDIKVSTHYLNHPALTLGYRLEADGVAVVYASDHEPHSRMLATGQGEITGQDLGHAEFVNRADLLIHDAQFTAEEYPAKIGWGHSTVEYVVELSKYAEVKRVALTHHDPFRDDDAIDRLLASIRARLREKGSSLDVFAAVGGQVVEVAPSHGKSPTRRAREFQAQMPIEPALAESSVLLGIVDTKMAAAFSKVIRTEGIHVEFFSAWMRHESSLRKIARRWRYLSTTRLVSTAWRRAARSASKITTTSINCPWSWSPHRKIRRPALRRASRTG